MTCLLRVRHIGTAAIDDRLHGQFADPARASPRGNAPPPPPPAPAEPEDPFADLSAFAELEQGGRPAPPPIAPPPVWAPAPVAAPVMAPAFAPAPAMAAAFAPSPALGYTGRPLRKKK